MKRINIGLLGCGTVGGGLVDLLRDNRDLVARRSGLDLHLQKVLVQDPEKEHPCTPELITTSPESILEDPATNNGDAVSTFLDNNSDHSAFSGTFSRRFTASFKNFFSSYPNVEKYIDDDFCSAIHFRFS